MSVRRARSGRMRRPERAASPHWLAQICFRKVPEESNLNRDTLAAALSERGVRPVRQIAIDDTWSALRFRPGD